MANQEHLDILKQGVEVWNAWRIKYIDVIPDLSGANLNEIDLFKGANFFQADFSAVSLSGANLIMANFAKANLINADLSHADLRNVNLNMADLSGANLREAHLGGVSCLNTNLSNVNLSHANLRGTQILGANLNGTNFIQAQIWETVLGDIDLRATYGLETTTHYGPSFISIDTIYRSGGDIPEAFLRGAGIEDTFITYMHALVGKPIEYYTCFISYCSKDQAFAECLYADLQSKNVRCWYAPEDIKIGDKFWHRIDESIRLYDKLLVILSEHSVASAWVENEVMAAFEKEHQRPDKTVLFPIKLDNTVMETNLPWVANMRRTRHIGDFTRWKEHDTYQKGLARLLRDLKQDAIKDKA